MAMDRQEEQASDGIVTTAGTQYRRVPRPSPVGGSGFVLGGVIGAAVYGPVGAVIGGALGLLAGEVLEYYLPSTPRQPMQRR